MALVGVLAVVVAPLAGFILGLCGVLPGTRRRKDLGQALDTDMKARTKWMVGGGLATAVVLAAVLASTQPPSPAGRYVAGAPPIISGDFYYEFSGGKVYFVDYERSGVSRRDEVGAYFQTPDGWFYRVSLGTNAVPIKTAPIKMVCSWAGVRLIDSNGKGELWRRRLLAGKRPEWMMLYLPWNLQ